MRTKGLLLFLCICCTLWCTAQNGYLTLNVTQPTDSITSDGAVHVSMTGITQNVHFALYRWDSTGTNFYFIDTGATISNLPQGIYSMFGAVGTHQIQAPDSTAIDNFYGNDLISEFTLGRSFTFGFLSNTTFGPDSLTAPSSGNCDGTLYFDPATVSGPNWSIISRTSSPAWTVGTSMLGRDSIHGLCEDVYAIITEKYATSFFYGDAFTAFPQYSIVAWPGLTSGPGQCDGSVYLGVRGGGGPYTWVVDSIAHTSSPVTGLCEGFHRFWVEDQGIIVGSGTFVIGQANNYYGISNPYGSPLDTILTDITNCNYDYNAGIDSSAITSVVAISDSVYVLHVEVWQQGQQIGVTDTIHVDSIGVHAVRLTMYCDTVHRSVQGTVTILGYVDFAHLNGVQDVSVSGAIKVFPNPADNIFYIAMKSGNIQTSDLDISDITGKVLRRIPGYLNNTPIDIGALAAGSYTVSLRNGAAVYSCRLIKF